MLVSVIMPMYNAEKYIKPCIDSILQQTFTNFELLIVDDGSTDDSAKIVAEYAKNDKRIKYHYQENRTACAALNKGIELAQGEYITFVDNDDLVDHNTYSNASKIISEYNPEIVVYGFSQDFIDEGYSTHNQISNGVADNKLDLQQMIIKIFQNGLFHPFWNKWYKRSMIINSGVEFDIRYNSMGDYSFNCRIFQYVEKIVSLDFIGYHYLKRNRDSLVASFVKDMIPCLIERRRLTSDLFSFYDLWSNDEALNYYAKQFCLESEDFLINLYKKNCNLSKSEKYPIIKKYILDLNSKKWYEKMHPNTLYARIFKFAVSTNSSFIIGQIYAILTFLKNSFFGLYKVFRKRQYDR